MLFSPERFLIHMYQSCHTILHLILGMYLSGLLNQPGHFPPPPLSNQNSLPSVPIQNQTHATRWFSNRMKAILKPGALFKRCISRRDFQKAPELGFEKSGGEFVACTPSSWQNKSELKPGAVFWVMMLMTMMMMRRRILAMTIMIYRPPSSWMPRFSFKIPMRMTENLGPGSLMNAFYLIKILIPSIKNTKCLFGNELCIFVLDASCAQDATALKPYCDIPAIPNSPSCSDWTCSKSSLNRPAARTAP